MKQSIIDQIIDDILRGHTVEYAYRRAKINWDRARRINKDFEIIPNNFTVRPSGVIGYIVRSEISPNLDEQPFNQHNDTWNLAKVPSPMCIAAQLSGILQPTREQIEKAFRDCAE